MIGSLGRDRAETSGELHIGPMSARAETQREMVTILPRRITRELVVVTPQTDGALEMPPSPTPATTAKPVEPPQALPPPPRVVSLAGGVRRLRGPGPAATMLLALAGVLTIVAVYLYVTRTGKREASQADSGVVVTPIVDAPDVESVVDAAMPVGTPDARLVEVPVDARVAPPDAAGPPDREQVNAQAKKLFDESKKAFEESDHTLALQLIDQSLKLRRTARGYILRGQVLQRLGRVDEALQALAAAEPIAAPHRGRVIQDVYEWRARILWSVRRRDEARAAMEEYLKLAPEGSASAQFRKWLETP
jgi:hypothetical protein